MKPKPEPKRRVTRRDIKICVVISDTHCGCRLAICGRDPCPVDDGGAYLPSQYQLRLMDMWGEFWQEWIPLWTKGEPYCVVFNGDDVDGVHHNSTTQISHNLGDQKRIAVALLKPVVGLCDGRYYHIRGTSAHVGEQAVNSEAIAQELGAIPNEDGQHARYDLWLTLGDRLVHLLHHIGTTGRTHYESSAVMAELGEEFTEAARWSQRPPDVIVRSHRHRALKVSVPSANGESFALVTPAWQLKTPFVWKIPGGRVSTPQVGGTIIVRGDRDLWSATKTWNVGRSATVTP